MLGVFAYEPLCLQGQAAFPRRFSSGSHRPFLEVREAKRVNRGCSALLLGCSDTAMECSGAFGRPQYQKSIEGVCIQQSSRQLELAAQDGVCL